MNHYNKLVRDRIPEIIKANGQTPIIKELKGKKLLDALVTKLFEEAEEVKDNPCAEELADLEEVILAIANELGITKQQLSETRKHKAKSRGSFTRGIYLEGIEP